MTAPLSILIIEDEPLISMMIEDYVDMLGHKVAGTADCCSAAIARLEQGGIDVAILDVNLRDGPCWPVADVLSAKGVPFVLATGGHVEPPPSAHAGARQLAKPFTLDGVKDALEAVSIA